MSFDAGDVAALFAGFAERFAAEREALIALDGKVGDSDLGITMSKGFAAAHEAAAALEDPVPGLQMKMAGAALAKAAPSTMGTLMATGFLRGSKALDGVSDVDTAALAAFWRAFADGVAQRGKARVGDKTVLDVLEPVAVACQEQASAGAGYVETLRAAEAVARDALEESRDLVAQHGKAAAFQEKSRGLPDAGGTVAVMLCEVWREVAEARARKP